MPSAKKRWFSSEEKRAGRIAVLLGIAVFTFLGWILRSADPRVILWFYPLCVLSLGAFAVAALNWSRWHNFQESMRASAYSVIAALQLLGFVILPLGLIVGTKGNLLLVLLIFIFYLAIPIAFYIVVGVPILIGVACISGAALYGLLIVMRKIGGVHEDPNHKAECHSPLYARSSRRGNPHLIDAAREIR